MDAHWKASNARKSSNFGGWTAFVQATNPPTVIAKVTGGVGDNREVAEANARLVAAAPELLAACQDMIRLADMGFEASLNEPEENGNYAAYNRAKAAIAKATGQKPN